jgi:ATP-binding cassette subfamily B (MDR/TAP) protein 1
VKTEEKSVSYGLNQAEKEIINRQLEALSLTVGYFALFKYAKTNEIIVMIVALVASIVAGAIMPLMTVRFLLPISVLRKKVYKTMFAV